MTTVLSSSDTGSSGILNYGDLKEQVANWLNKTNLTDDLPIFVRLAETTIRRDVRVRVQEQFEAGTATAETIDVPTRFLEAKRLYVGTRRKEYRTPEEFLDLTIQTSQADYYTVIGEDIHVLGGATDSTYSLLYWQEFEAFVSDTDTNWLLLNAPGVYLWQACKEGAEFLKDFEAADRFDAKYQRDLMALNNSEKAMRHSGSTLAVRPRGSTP